MFEGLVRDVAAALGVSASDTLELLQVCQRLGMDSRAVESDLRAVVKQRLFLWLIGDVSRELNFEERKKFVLKRLRSITSGPALEALVQRPGLIDRIAEIQAGISLATESTRIGIQSMEEVRLRELFVKQQYRCAVCGVPLHSNYRKPTSRFADGYEPSAPAHLEHIVPYYIVGNLSDFELLCISCNLLKNDRLGVQEDGPVLSANHIRPRNRREIRRRMAFWTLYDARKCTAPSCDVDTRRSILLVETGQTQLYTYGNLQPKCLEHASESAVWLHGVSSS